MEAWIKTASSPQRGTVLQAAIPPHWVPHIQHLAWRAVHSSTTATLFTLIKDTATIRRTKKMLIFRTSDKIWLTKVRAFVRNYQIKVCNTNQNMKFKTKTSSQRRMLFSNTLLPLQVKYTLGIPTTRVALRDNFTNQRRIEPPLELSSLQWLKINRDIQICKIMDTNKGLSGWPTKRVGSLSQPMSKSRLT